MKVHQHHVGPQPPSRRWDFGAIGAFAKDLDTSLATERYCQHFAEQRLVVNDQNANHDPTLLGYVEVTRRDSLDDNWRCQRSAAADSFDLGCSPSCDLIRIERI